MMTQTWKQGDREPFWLFGLQPGTGTLDITGLSTSDFTLVFIDTDGNERSGDGVFSNLTAASGSTPALITYAPSANDVATLGKFERRVVIDRATSNQRTFDLGFWSCEL